MLERKLRDQLLDFLDYFPVIGIVGPRQVGKTTFIKQNLHNFKKDCIYIDLESPEDYNKLYDAELFLKSLEDKTVIIDEIQLRPELFPILRSLVDRQRVPGRFIVLGSASPDLIRDSSESLAGRIVYLEINPFDIVELYKIKTYEQLWLRGGFPNAILQEDENISTHWMRSFIQTYIERDLPILGLGAPIKTIERLWLMLAHVNGNLLNYTQISNSLGVSLNSVKSYIQFFEKAYLIRTLQPFHINTKKRLVKSPKIFFRDTGILHHLLRLYTRDDLFGHPNAGNSWEAFVIQQIINNLPLTVDTYFYRTQDGSEIDLIINRGINVLAAIEIRHSNAPKLSKGNTLAINTIQSQRNFIITPSSDDYPIKENVQVCNLNRFIDHHLPILCKTQ
ncbi:MAG: ATP-binding protein [Bacteroidota bacterium]|nr:ATP-binding protein [Bacteroidota bacterium]